MRLAWSPRAERMLGRLPRPTAMSALELLLLTLLAVQCARLVWTAVTPVGPVGDWRPAQAAMPAAAAAEALGGFDPFFRLTESGGEAVVTSLDLTLFGVREDRATGRGSAIIGLPDGAQASFAVGEEILPGVTLSAVGFDHVTISRGGTPEQIFLDQSEPAQTVGGEAPAVVTTAPPPPVATPPAATPLTIAAAGGQVQMQPRMAGDQVTGIVVRPGGGGEAFRAAGFAPGDVIVSINGQRVSSLEQARAVGAGGEARLIVERNGRAVPLVVRIGR